MTARLRTALIGAGDIGGLRAQAVTQCPGLELAAVADVALPRAEALAVRYGAEASADGLGVASRPDVDLVIVSTPPDRHAQFALAALAAGKHVLCEKPLAHSLADAEQMCLVAEQRGLLLMTGFNHRHYPPMAHIDRLISAGQIGQVVAVHAYAGHAGGQEFGHDWVHDAAVTGGGSLVDNGIHALDLIRFYIGEVERAVGYTANLIWSFEPAEDYGLGFFRTAGGQVAQVHACWTDWSGYHFSVLVTGTRGYARASYPPMFAEWGSAPAAGARPRRRFEVFPRAQVLERLRTWRWTVVNSFVSELNELVKGIRSGQEASPTGRDGLRALQMAHAIYRSAREGREVVV